MLGIWLARAVCCFTGKAIAWLARQSLMFPVKGSCYCANIVVDLNLSNPPESYNPRACDCYFCRKHGASYLSDPAGTLCISVKDMQALGNYRQGGDGIASFLHCLTCGVLIGVMYQNEADGKTFGAINSLIIDESTHFGAPVSASPKKLSNDEKIKRWKEVWFSNVTITAPKT